MKGNNAWTKWSEMMKERNDLNNIWKKISEMLTGANERERRMKEMMWNGKSGNEKK